MRVRPEALSSRSTVVSGDQRDHSSAGGVDAILDSWRGCVQVGVVCTGGCGLYRWVGSLQIGVVCTGGCGLTGRCSLGVVVG